LKPREFFLPEDIKNAACGNGQRRTRRLPTPQPEMTNAARGVCEFCNLLINSL
jgi:hypothetical protein